MWLCVLVSLELRTSRRAVDAGHLVSHCIPPRTRYSLNTLETAKMVVMYEIAGRKVGSHVVSRSAQPSSRGAFSMRSIHEISPECTLTCRILQLAMATLGTMFAGGFLALGGSKKSQEKGPPINATNSDEENFIRYVTSPPPQRKPGWLWSVQIAES